MTITETPAAGEFTMTSGCDSNSCDDIPPLQLQLREILHDARERGRMHRQLCRCCGADDGRRTASDDR